MSGPFPQHLAEAAQKAHENAVAQAYRDAARRAGPKARLIVESLKARMLDEDAQSWRDVPEPMRWVIALRITGSTATAKTLAGTKWADLPPDFQAKAGAIGREMRRELAPCERMRH